MDVCVGYPNKKQARKACSIAVPLNDHYQGEKLYKGTPTVDTVNVRTCGVAVNFSTTTDLIYFLNPVDMVWSRPN